MTLVVLAVKCIQSPRSNFERLEDVPLVSKETDWNWFFVSTKKNISVCFGVKRKKQKKDRSPARFWIVWPECFQLYSYLEGISFFFSQRLVLQFCKQEVWLQKKVSLCGKRALTSLFTPQTRSLSNLPSVCHQKFKLSASLSVHMISGTEKYIKKCLLRGLLIKRITKKKLDSNILEQNTLRFIETEKIHVIF